VTQGTAAQRTAAQGIVAQGTAEARVVAFDADVLIYAAVPNHSLGVRVARFLESAAAYDRVAQADTPRGETGAALGNATGGTPTGTEAPVCIGSTLLIPELLTKPMRHGHEAERRSLIALLARLRLVPVDERIAELAAGLGANYGLRAMDALHLACAVGARAGAFVTNNRKDFSRERVLELEIVHPEQLE
jgi:predicted nucleic acid-binding protein